MGEWARAERRTASLLVILLLLVALAGVAGEAPDSQRQSSRHQRIRDAQGVRDAGADGELWTKYVSDTPRTLAEELRVARESERKRAERQNRRSSSSNNNGGIIDTVADTAKAAADAAGVTKGVKAVKKAKNKVQRALDSDDLDDDDDEDDDVDGVQSTSKPSRRRKGLKKVSATTTSIWSFAVSAVRNGFWIAVAIARYLYNNCVWTPMTYVAVALRWSANASWQTTQWTSERALFGPVRTATAPLVYLVEGLLFIFVMIPARFIRAVVRELYPVYVFLGAALAVGTAMGIAAAAVLFIGSYVLGDQSEMEKSLRRRGEELPNDVQRHLRNQYVDPYLDGKTGKLSSAFAADSSWQSTAIRAGEGVIQKAIRESLLREERKNGQFQEQQQMQPNDREGDPFENDSSYERAWQDSIGLQRSGTAPDSDEDDDYFGMSNVSSSAASKDKSTASQGGARNPRQSASSYQRSLPVGATSQGGWSSRSESASSTPAISPTFARPSMSASPYAMATSSGRSPLISPTTTTHAASTPDAALRSQHARQRRSVPQATSVM
jgi:hypothetical protein